MAQEEDEVRRIWKEYYEDLYNIDTQEQVAVYMCSFDRIRRGNYFRREPLGELRLSESREGCSIIERPLVNMRSQENDEKMR